ncbi:MAG: hypothetical protein J3K34DRAFT_478963 [Monoraphidium minutum]|nr:MAG: hypothetical protein J3K34DRAFT_478963 [Monoraphidium minutum]
MAGEPFWSAGAPAAADAGRPAARHAPRPGPHGQQQQQLQQQQQQRRRRLRGAAPPGEAAARALSAQLKHGTAAAQDVLAIAEARMAEFNEVHVCLSLSRLAALLRFDSGAARAAAKAHPAFASLLAAAEAGAPRLGGRQVSMALTALAWLQHAGAPGLLDALEARARSLLARGALEPEDACHCLWALSKLGRHPGALLADACADALASGWLHQLPAKPLAGLLWVAARGAAGGAAQPAALPALLAAALADVGAPGFLETFAPQELSMLLWSLATLGRGAGGAAAPASVPPALLARVLEVAAERAVSFTPQGIANSCWALSRLAPGALAASGAARPLLGAAPEQAQGDQQQQQAVAAAAAEGGKDNGRRLAAAAARFLSAFLGSAAAQLEYYRPQEVANLLGAAAALGARHAALEAAAAGYLRSKGHLLGAWDVAEALCALLRLRGGAPPEPAVLQRLAHRGAALARGMPPAALARCAWAVARAGGDAAPLVTAAAERAAGDDGGGGGSAFVAALAPRELAQLMWAAAAAQALAPAQAAAAAAARGGGRPRGPAAEAQRQQLQARLARLRRDAAALLAAAQGELLARLAQCDSHTLTVALVAAARCARAGAGDADAPPAGGAVFAAAASWRLAAAAGGAAPQHAAAGAWAAARLALGGEGGGASAEQAAAAAAAGSLLSATLTGIERGGGWRRLPPGAAAALLWAAAASPPALAPPPGHQVALLRAAGAQVPAMAARDASVVCWASARLLLRAAPGAGAEQGALSAAARAAHGAACGRVVDAADAWLRRGTAQRPAAGAAGGSGAALCASHLAAAAVSCARLGAMPPELEAAVLEAWDALAAAGAVGAAEGAQLLWALARCGRPAPRHCAEDAAAALLPRLAGGGGGGARGDAPLAALALEALCMLRHRPSDELARAAQQRIAEGLASAAEAPPCARAAAARAACAALYHLAALGLDPRPLLAAAQPLLAPLLARAPRAALGPLRRRRHQQQQQQPEEGQQPRLGTASAVRLLWALCAAGATHGRLGKLAASAVFARGHAAAVASDPRLSRLLIECRMALRAQRPAAWRCAAPGWMRLRAQGVPRRVAGSGGAAVAAEEHAARQTLAAELSAAGVEPGQIAWVRLPNGDAYGCVMVSPGHLQAAQWRGAAVVFDGARHRAANGGAPLGAARVRDAALLARGLQVVALPLRLWAEARRGGGGGSSGGSGAEQRRVAARRLAAALASSGSGP